jgi:hypothetical protein
MRGREQPATSDLRTPWHCGCVTACSAGYGRCVHASPIRPNQAVDDDVRSALLDRYEELITQLPTLSRAWVDRANALRAGEITVEPGWMLRPILGETIEIFGLYRVYNDGRVERDRLIERAEKERFRRAAASARDTREARGA